MKHDRIDDKARVWVLVKGSDGKLHDEFDPQFLTALGTAHSAEDVANVLITTAGRLELAENRLW